MQRVAMNDRCHTLAHRSAGLVTIMLMSIVGSAAAGTIDFESPALGSEDAVLMNVYQQQGVTVTASPEGVLLRESAFYPCPGIGETNQSFRANMPYFGCFSCCTSIRIDFPPPPADPVLHVAAEVRAGQPVLRLRLYDAGGTVIGSTELRPPAASCFLPIRGTLEASALLPIAYAVISNPDGLPPPDDCTAGTCCTDGPIVVVDNVTFDSGAVPVRSTSWGALKSHHR